MSPSYAHRWGCISESRLWWRRVQLQLRRETLLLQRRAKVRSPTSSSYQDEFLSTLSPLQLKQEISARDVTRVTKHMTEHVSCSSEFNLRAITWADSPTRKCAQLKRGRCLLPGCGLKAAMTGWREKHWRHHITSHGNAQELICTCRLRHLV